MHGLRALTAEFMHCFWLSLAELTKDRKRQILADILVWAEITQTHYDAATRRLVCTPF
jgi:hypothetical protein